MLWLWVWAGAAGAAPESWPKGSLEVGALAAAPLLLASKSDIPIMTGSRLGGLASGKGVPLVLAPCSCTALVRAPLLPPAELHVSVLMRGQAMARSMILF